MFFSKNAIRAYRRRGVIPPSLTAAQMEELLRLAFPPSRTLHEVLRREAEKLRRKKLSNNLVNPWRPDKVQGRVKSL